MKPTYDSSTNSKSSGSEGSDEGDETAEVDSGGITGRADEDEQAAHYPVLHRMFKHVLQGDCIAAFGEDVMIKPALATLSIKDTQYASSLLLL